MVVYFSGTGNSRYCAKMIAHKTGDEALDCLTFIKEQIAPQLISSKPWVFVCPVYAWQMPRVFERFIRSGSFDGAKDAYFVMTCGSEIGNAAKKAQELSSAMGLNYKGTLQVCMPENFIAMFPVPSEEKCSEMLAAAGPVLEKGAQAILNGENFAQNKVNLIDKFKSGPINSGFYLACMKAKNFTVSDKCIGCKKCEELCALNNIKIIDSRPVWGENCTQCMACICGCPTEAIEYGKRSAGKMRYQCPEYKCE